jgi:hypothetical protein
MRHAKTPYEPKLNIIPVPTTLPDSDDRYSLRRLLASAASFAIAVYFANRGYHDLRKAAAVSLIFSVLTYFPFWLASTFFGRGAIYFYREWQENKLAGALAGTLVYGLLSALCWVGLAALLYLLQQWLPYD